jgi:superfamily I DNA/RNA helicase
LRDEEKAFFEATRSQYKVLSMLGRKRRALICGAAGSGKTFLALEKAHTLAKAGNDVLILCYNHRLAEWLRTQSPQTGNISIFHYHGLCSYFCRLANHPIPTPDPLSDPKNFFAAELPEALMDAIAATDRRFDAIIVDEGQDFEALWWISVQELLKEPEESSLYIFCDDNQHIYSTRLEFPIKEEPLLLCENCRNTQKIHAEVMKSYRGASECTAIGPEGRTPVEIQVASDQEERTAVEAAIKKLLNQENVPAASIVVLTSKAQTRSKWRESEKLAGHPLSWATPCPNGAIACATIHSFKGLESPVVILTEMTEPDTNRLRQLSYVGASRAKSHLIIVRTG